MSYRVYFNDGEKSLQTFPTADDATHYANTTGKHYKILYSAPESWTKACERFVKNVFHFYEINGLSLPKWTIADNSCHAKNILHPLHTTMCELPHLYNNAHHKLGMSFRYYEDEEKPIIGRAISLCRAVYGQHCDYKSIIGLED